MATSEIGLRVTYVGHATTVLELDGVRILTDPVLRPGVAQLRRLVPLSGPAVEAVGRPDAILVSHLHADHFDPRSIRMFGSGVAVVVPAGGAVGLLRRRGFTDVRGVGEGDEVRLGAVLVRAVHARHRGGRGLPWIAGPALGYVVAGSASAYFAGDTALFPEMSRLAGPDVALLPVAGWGSRLPAGEHMGPRQAAEALRLLGPRFAVPVHWGTLAPLWRPGGYPRRRSPALEFRDLAAELAPQVEVRVLEPGQALRVPARR
jgi:L-ascorbate metabolism protein UlaG (beta-lactamase superfamily)